jgi:CubicO group peptidase (beta-lactamase class C family)
MRAVLKWVGRGLLAVVLIAVVVGIWQRETITRLMAAITLYDADKIVNNLSNMDRMFWTVDMDRGDGPVAVFDTGAPMTLPADVQTWITDFDVTALVVLKDGKLVFDKYYLGTKPSDKRMSFSVAKSFLSALMGVVLADGAIGSIDDPVIQYVPALKGSAYDGASIKDVLQMSSGVTFDEDYLAFNSDINKMSRTLALGQSMDRFTENLSETFQAPGTAWKYVSIDTHVLGMVIRGATGRPIAELMQEKIIAKLGFEETPRYMVDGHGVAFVLGGLNVTTRDYARFAQMIAQNGEWQGQQVVPADWIAASTAASAKTAAGEFGYGYQWWIPVGAGPGEVMGRGIYDQYIYINQQSGVVVAVNAANRRFRVKGASERNVAMLRQISAALAE